MRTLVIGDIHARDVWEEIVEKEEWDNVVFIGDYTDTFMAISPLFEVENLKKILDLKRNNPNKVTLLIGNHDYHYFPEVDQRYSGWEDHKQKMFGETYQEALDEGLLQFAYLQDDILFTHAGVTDQWVKNWKVDTNNIEESINDLPFEAFAFHEKGFRTSPFGDDIWQSPIWIRPNSLERDYLESDYVDGYRSDYDDGYRQVVGHTRQEHVFITGNFCYVDALWREYLIVQDGDLIVGKTVDL